MTTPDITAALENALARALAEIAPAPEVEYLDTPAAAAFLSMTPVALEMMRFEGRGPAYSKFNKRAVRYRRQDLLEWAEARKVVPAGQ